MPRMRTQPYTRHNPVTCPVCGFEAVSHYNLVRHYALKHTDMIAIAEKRLSEAGVVAMAQEQEKDELTMKDIEEWAKEEKITEEDLQRWAQ